MPATSGASAAESGDSDAAVGTGYTLSITREVPASSTPLGTPRPTPSINGNVENIAAEQAATVANHEKENSAAPCQNTALSGHTIVAGIKRKSNYMHYVYLSHALA